MFSCDAGSSVYQMHSILSHTECHRTTVHDWVQCCTMRAIIMSVVLLCVLQNVLPRTREGQHWGQVSNCQMFATLRSLLVLCILHLFDWFLCLPYSVIKPDHKLTSAGISLVTMTPQRLFLERSCLGQQAAGTVRLFAVVKHSSSGGQDKKCSD